MKQAKLSNVFAGKDAIQDFLNPALRMPTPLVELDSELNSLAEKGARIFAKLEFLTPLLTIKWLAAHEQFRQAKEDGNLEGVKEADEASSGGAAFAESVIARVVHGISRFTAVVPWDIAPAKLDALRLVGVNPVLSNTLPSGVTAIEYARIMGQKPGHFCANQYHNEANAKGYEKWLAPELWTQTEGNVDVVCASLGTTGTGRGLSKFLKAKNEHIIIIGAAPVEDKVPGARSPRRLDEVGKGWESAIDHRVDVEHELAFTRSLQLWRKGILGGPSSGLALEALLRFLDEGQEEWVSRGITGVFICPDIPQLYTEKYSVHLEEPPR